MIANLSLKYQVVSCVVVNPKLDPRYSMCDSEFEAMPAITGVMQHGVEFLFGMALTTACLPR